MRRSKELGMGLIEMSITAALVALAVLVGVSYVSGYIGPKSEGVVNEDIIKQ
jgi:hypothetical protein